MENIILLSQNELAKITNHRSGEIKFGEKIITIPKDTDIIEFITNSEAKFVLFGIPEDIGVKANLGRVGAASAYESALSSLANIQHFESFLLLVFFILGFLGILNHAMWRDELNGWLIARDSASLTDFWNNIRYEGHPILWYAFLYLLNQMTANPVAMQLFHLGLATASTSLFVCYAPFTRLQKLLFVLGYLPLYEYLVISRNYAIAVLILWAICVCFPTRQKNYFILAILLALLANTNAYALLISLSLSFTLILEFLLRHPLKLELKASFLNRGISLLIILVGVMLAVALLIPPADSNLQGGADQWFFNWDFHRFNQSLSRIWNSYILVLVPGDAKPLDVFLFAILSIGIFSFCVTFFWDYPIVLAFYSCGTGSILLFTYLKFKLTLWRILFPHFTLVIRAFELACCCTNSTNSFNSFVLKLSVQIHFKVYRQTIWHCLNISF
jgi:hypothetical protein